MGQSTRVGESGGKGEQDGGLVTGDEADQQEARESCVREGELGAERRQKKMMGVERGIGKATRVKERRRRMEM